ncbi:efflux RND transporter periplasmic adaptor subunit [Aliikangiella marina]|uniref:Efflux RND transporter periplasmic adaptor subunit n=1 Tax=Aliikangiella marina TaxID=1712262 RepID=A0A545T1J2_9GAMM|nr:efflux RND transporter periplasmic adaptor subunit [Aliikangiella marina]TQV71098.1 efflux RND transporter periplasmic adaptor subunit [Aliikangiella marina]
MNIPNNAGKLIMSDASRRIVIYLLAGLVFLASGIALKAFSQTDIEPAERKLVVNSQVVEVLPGYYIDRYFSAQVLPQQSVAVASEVAGKVTAIFVDDGERVEQGQKLFQLDTLILEQQLARFAAQQESVRADIDLAEKRLTRQKNLNQNSFSSEDTIDALASQIAQLNASLASLKAQSKDIQIRIDKSTIYSPFAGQIQKRNIDIGAVINAGLNTFELVDNNLLEIQVGLPTQLVKQIEISRQYQFIQANQTITAKAIAILPRIDSVTQTQGVKFTLPSDSQLVPGDFVKLKLPSYQETEGLWVANTALIEGEKGLWQIFVIDNEGRVNKQTVSIIYPGNPNSFVQANIKSGQKVVINGVHRLANRVAVIEEKTFNLNSNNVASKNTNQADLDSSQSLSVGASQ